MIGSNAPFSVVVPSRDRMDYLTDFIQSVSRTVPSSRVKPSITIILDSPSDSGDQRRCLDLLSSEGLEGQVICLPQKSSLAQLWNYCVMFSPGDWTYIAGDDSVVKPGWYQFLSKQIATGKFLRIDLCAASGMAIHKSLIPLVGWFDESFRGGYFEDTDMTIRMNEYDQSVWDLSCDMMYADHERFKHSTPEKPKICWDVENNQEWFCRKWGKPIEQTWDFTVKHHRCEPELDWHPAFTRQYCERFGVSARFDLINSTVGKEIKVFPV